MTIVMTSFPNLDEKGKIEEMVKMTTNRYKLILYIMVGIISFSVTCGLISGLYLIFGSITIISILILAFLRFKLLDKKSVESRKRNNEKVN